MSENSERAYVDAERVVSSIESYKRTITAIRAGLRAEMPEVMRELDEAEQALPKVQEEAKVVLRLLGPGNHEIGGHVISVKKPASRVEVDIEGILERAEERGETQLLLDAGVLKYDVQAHQIGRLDGKQKAIYEGYLKEVSGTSSVTLPPDLK